VINQNDIREPGFPETNIQITDQGLNLIYGNIPTRTLPRRQYLVGSRCRASRRHRR
jgi:hypothetical protein